MPDRVSTSFGEATAGQQILCCKLEATAFAAPLTESDYVEREAYMGERFPGLKYWCLSRADDPTKILASCKTIPREIIIHDSDGIRTQGALCIASVVTDSQHRGQGFASQLLAQVAKWMDGPGNTVSSMLYTSIGNFYDSRGWKMQRAFHSILTCPSGRLVPHDRKRLPKSRYLNDEEIPSFCARDVERVKADFAKLQVASNQAHMAVLPTEAIIRALQDLADFTTLKVYDQTPQHHGSLCEEADTWAYWVHNFRKEQLGIQRIRCPDEENELHVKGIASVLLDAVEEASTWKLPYVVVWEPGNAVKRALKLLGEEIGVEIKSEGRTSKSMPSLRWRDSDETKAITVHMNEFYACMNEFYAWN